MVKLFVDDLNADDIRAFERGEWSSVIVKVKASIQPLPFKGSDILGGVWCKTHAPTADILDTIEDHKMIESAIGELTADIHQAKRLMEGFAL